MNQNLKNPYIKEDENCCNQPQNYYNQSQGQSNLDKKINNALQDLPFVPKNFDSANFLKGVLLGAGVAYILTNKKAQEALFKSIVKAGELLQTGVEELKERFEDVKAEIEANK